MVIWLRREAALGVSSDVIRAADRHRVVELDAAVQAVYEERDAVLAAARAKAEAIVAQARAVADDLIKDANERAANSEQLGYAEGSARPWPNSMRPWSRAPTARPNPPGAWRPACRRPSCRRWSASCWSRTARRCSRGWPRPWAACCRARRA